MRVRTLLAITATMFVLPALAAEPPAMPVPRELPAPTPAVRPAASAPKANEPSEVSVCFEVRVVKAPVGFCERAGVKLAGDAVLTDAQLYRVLEAAQAQRDVMVMQYPKLTADDGQTATVRVTISASS